MAKGNKSWFGKHTWQKFDEIYPSGKAVSGAHMRREVDILQQKYMLVKN